MNFFPIREQTWRFLRAFFMTSTVHHITAGTLAKLILSSLKLFPVALTAQFTGMASLTAVYWQSGVSEVFLTVWFCCGLIQIWLSLRYVRLFWRDANREANIRKWIRRWTALAVSAGIIWGVAGPTLMVPFQGAHQMITVATIVAVTFASWPVYSCWLPSLSAFTLCSLTPVIVAGAVQFGVSQTLIALIILVTTVFILYSGRKLNEMVVNSIITAAQNERLVERLRIEIARAEKARRQTEEESERRSKFFAAANHDIRQPLQAMGIYIDILGRRATPQTEPVVKQLALSISAISTLVEQVLTVTRMEFGQMELHPEHASVRELLEELAEECRPIAEKKGLRLRVSAPHGRHDGQARPQESGEQRCRVLRSREGPRARDRARRATGGEPPRDRRLRLRSRHLGRGQEPHLRHLLSRSCGPCGAGLRLWPGALDRARHRKTARA